MLLCKCLTYISSHDVVGVVVDVPSQSEVADLRHSALRHQHVTSRQVSMDALQTDGPIRSQTHNPQTPSLSVQYYTFCILLEVNFNVNVSVCVYSQRDRNMSSYLTKMLVL